MVIRKFFLLVIILGLIIVLNVSQRTDIVMAEGEVAGCAPVPDGLVYWLRAEDNANDFTGEHNGIIFGGMTFTTGMVGNSFLFDGEDDYVLIPSSPDLPNGADARTIEMWVYSVDNTWLSDKHPVFHTGGDSIRESFGIDFDSYPVLQFYTWEDDLYVSTDLSKTGWFHVTLAYDGDTLLSVYINGILKDSKVLSGLLNTQNLATFIGTDLQREALETSFLGKIDEVSMYDRALSPQEILSIYNAGSFGKCTNKKPVAHAGNDQTVHTNTIVTLDGGQSYDPDSILPLSYSWTQFEGETVILNNPSTPNPSFIAPSISGKLTFSLVVTDSEGLSSDFDYVDVIVNYYKINLPVIIR